MLNFIFSYEIEKYPYFFDLWFHIQHKHDPGVYFFIIIWKFKLELSLYWNTDGSS